MNSINKNSRTYNSIVNSLIGIIAAVLNILLNFGVRIVIVHTLGEEINGIHSLLQNILNILTLVETSMTTAMIIHLYEPIKSNDTALLGRILGLYKKIYYLLAIVLLFSGSIISFFIDDLITTTIDIFHIRIYFGVFILNVVVNYITYSHRIILFASQKNRVSTLATLISELLFRGLATVLSVIYHNYLLFLFCFMGEKILGNYLCKCYVKKKYAGIVCSIYVESDEILKNKIILTVKPLIVTRIAEVLQNSSQSILISILLGNIAVVGYYGNYVLVTGAVGLIYSQLGAAFTSSFGNLATEGNCERMYKAYRKADFIMSSLASIIFSGFVVCIQDFISLTFGNTFLLSDISVVIIATSMFITLINIPIISIQNATGTHNEDAHNMLIQALLSVVLGYVGGKLWDMEGLLLGSLLPVFFFTTIVKGIKIYNVLFKEKICKYFISVFTYMLSGVLICLITISMTRLIDFDVIILNIFCKGIMTVFVSVVVLSITMFKSEYFKTILMMILKKYKR